MSTIYRKHGVKKKVFNYKKVLRPNLEAQLPELKAKLKKEIDQAREDKYKVIWIDETMFTRKAVKRTEWARTGENAEVDDKLLND